MADSAESLQIYARLNTNHHVLGENIATSLRYPRSLMISEPESMAGAVQALIFGSVPLHLQVLIHGRVKFATWHTRADHIERDAAGLHHGRKCFAHFAPMALP